MALRFKRTLVVIATLFVVLAAAVGMMLTPWKLATVDIVEIGNRTPSSVRLPQLPGGTVRNVILMIGDGMGLSELTAGRINSFGPDGRFVLERFPITGVVTTHTRSTLVTDSSAAATAMASGGKTNYGRLGTTPEGTATTTLVDQAHEAGLVVGLVTTAPIYDATPAAFAAHVEWRDDVPGITRQLSEAPIDLLVGGGRAEFFALDGAGGGAKSPRAVAAEKGVTIVENEAGLKAARKLPVWGIFEGKDLGLVPGSPELATLTEESLRLMADEAARRQTGFFAMIEEEAIDSAAHSRNMPQLSAALRRFDSAVEVAAKFAADRGDTLVLVVGDHGTGGLTIGSSQPGARFRVTWAASGHSGEPVILYAYGPHDAALAFTGMMDNTGIHKKIASLIAAQREDQALARTP